MADCSATALRRRESQQLEALTIAQDNCAYAIITITIILNFLESELMLPRYAKKKFQSFGALSLLPTNAEPNQPLLPAVYQFMRGFLSSTELYFLRDILR